MDEEKRETGETPFEKEEPADFGYMNELLKAYNESLRKKKAQNELSDEKKAYIASAERRVKEIASSIAARAPLAEIKELAFMAKESAEGCLNVIGEEDPSEEKPRDYANFPLPALLSRAVLLANRALNALVRNGRGNDRAISLILSQLSALYAIAAIR